MIHVHGHSCVYKHSLVEYMLSEAFDSSVLRLRFPGSRHVQGTREQACPLFASIGVGGVTPPASFSQRSAGVVIRDQ